MFSCCFYVREAHEPTKGLSGVTAYVRPRIHRIGLGDDLENGGKKEEKER